MRIRWVLVGLIGAAASAGAAIALVDASPIRALQRSFDVAPVNSTIWPSDQAELRAPDVKYPDGFGTFKIFVDPGHGAKDNKGNTSCLCEDEQDFTLALANELAIYLRSSGHFEVEVSRSGEELVAYGERVERATEWKADVFLSLHSDVRGHAAALPGPEGCLCSESAPGFSVLWSDEGEAAAARLRLARSMARAMSGAGFPFYDGAEYETYEADPDCGGVFVDRHALAKRIYVLRKPPMPSVIMETHNARDPREAHRWRARKTREVFFGAVAAGLVEFLARSE